MPGIIFYDYTPRYFDFKEVVRQTMCATDATTTRCKFAKYVTIPGGLGPIWVPSGFAGETAMLCEELFELQRGNGLDRCFPEESAGASKVPGDVPEGFRLQFSAFNLGFPVGQVSFNHRFKGQR